MDTPLTRVLERLQGVKSGGDGYTALCPAHEDTSPSLSVRAGDDGRVLIRCFAGCQVEDVVSSIDLTMRDLFSDSTQSFPQTPRKDSITVEDLAADKHLPVEFLKSLGLENRSGGVIIPYHQANGKKASRHRLRTALVAKEGSLWTFGKGRPIPYGLDRLQESREAGYVILVEGESDCWTLWHYGFPALGLPGSSMASKLQLPYLKGITRLSIIQEPGQGGDSFVEGLAHRLSRIAWKGVAKVVRLNHAKDPNALHQMNPDKFIDAMRSVLDCAEILNLDSCPPPTSVRKDDDVTTFLINTGVAALSNVSSPSEIEATLRRFSGQLVGVDALRRSVAFQTAISKMKDEGIEGARNLVSAALKDFSQTEPDHQGQSLVLEAPEPWDEPVDGAELANSIVLSLSEYVSLPEHAAEGIVLWILHCYAFAATSVSPILAIRSPEKRCGKTTLLENINALVPKAVLASNITPAALFRAIEKYRPTLLVDEADTFMTRNDELRGVINSGHIRSSACVIRSVGDDHEPKVFSTWCPKAIALIGRLPATIEDRSIVISMKRRSAGELLKRLRRDRIHQEMEPRRQRASRWAADHLDEIRELDPLDIPSLHDRAQDNWRPLISIAEALGGEWPERARSAAVSLHSESDEEETTATIQLLSDLRQIFSENGKPFLGSGEIIADLIKMEDRPWAEWKKGKELSKVQLSRLLRRYEVVPTQTHRDGKKLRGYASEQFEDCWARYLPSESGHSELLNVFNELDSISSRDQVGTVPSQLGTPQQIGSTCPDSESGCPELDQEPNGTAPQSPYTRKSLFDDDEEVKI